MTTTSQQLPKDYEERIGAFCAYCNNRITENKIQVSAVVVALTKTWIYNDRPVNSNGTESDDDERDLNLFDAAGAQLLKFDAGKEEFDGFVEEQWLKRDFFAFCSVISEQYLQL